MTIEFVTFKCITPPKREEQIGLVESLLLLAPLLRRFPPLAASSRSVHIVITCTTTIIHRQPRGGRALEMMLEALFRLPEISAVMSAEPGQQELDANLGQSSLDGSAVQWTQRQHPLGIIITVIGRGHESAHDEVQLRAEFHLFRAQMPAGVARSSVVRREQ